MDSTEKLMKIKRGIERAKERRAQVHGRRDELRKQLKDDFKCKDVDSGRSRLESMRERDTRDKKEIRRGIAEWEEKYGEDS